MRFDKHAEQFVFEQYLLAIEHLQERIEHIEAELTRISEAQP